MLVYTMTKKQIIRTATIAVLALAAILIIICAVTGSVTASAQKGKSPITSVDRTDNKIALTFDCAWGSSNTAELLEVLKKADARATFFVTGEFCDSFPADVRKISAAGHSVQNLSDDYSHIKGMNINSLIESIKSCGRKITTLTGKEPRFFRTPFGEYDDESLTTAEGMGYKVIRWSADSLDIEDPDAPTIKKRILEKTEPGGILLFHNDLGNTLEALPSLLTELRQKGFELVTIDELVYEKDYIIDDGGKQLQDPARSASVPIVYSDNAYLSSGFEKIRANLSIQEIYDLSSAGKVTLIDRIKSFLTDEEINAFREASYNELREAYLSLVYTAEHYGAGGAYRLSEPKPSETTVPEIIIPSETEKTPDTHDTYRHEEEEEEEVSVK